jgi:two-component system sensor histidine kinase BaeS
MRSLAFKLIIAFLAVSLVGTALVALLAGRVTANEFGRFVFDREQSLFVDELAEYYQVNGSWAGVETLIPGGRMPGGRGMGPGSMLLVDAAGEVVIDGAGHRSGEQLPQEEVARGRPILVNEQRVGTLVGGGPFRPNVSEGAFLSRVNRTLIWSALGATTVALFLGVFLTRALTQPLQELKAATRAVAQGDFGHQVEVYSQDEIGELTVSFNQMSADLARSRNTRRQMTADIAHELRTPLSLILGHAEALNDGVLPPTPETFHIIHDEARRLSRLVEDLRTLSLAEADELPLARRQASPGFLLEQVTMSLAARMQQEKVDLQLDIAPDLPEVFVDPDRMAQVLTNLLENALRYTPQGGKITLAAGRSLAGVRLSVTDQGPGIEPEEMSRIFERFYRVDKSRQRHEGGSGLGLAIARSIVMGHQGRIWAESEPGKGTTFFIELPAATP